MPPRRPPRARKARGGKAGRPLLAWDLPMTAPRPHLSHRHVLLYRMAVHAYRLRRRLRWRVEELSGRRTASVQAEERLPFRVKKHESRLLRQLGQSEMWLQHNKVKNLAIALQPIHGLLIRPGETFSFWRRVGPPTRERGFIEGMEISRGEARPGVGGGICQIANVLHWLVLHSPLVVTERSTHSYDPFPDQGRSIPYGTGCSVFFNYVDFQFHNPTPITFQLCLSLTDRFLVGDLRSSEQIALAYTVMEKDSAFSRVGELFYRHNTLWRQVRERRTGRFLQEEFIKKNLVRVMYVPAGVE
jgi:vancomycin resistance protein VanW